MKLRLACAVVLFCLLFAASSSLLAQETGVLIGLGTKDGFQTHWIVLGPNAPPQAIIPEIIVPVGAEFWRIGERDWCDVEDLTDVENAQLGAAFDTTTERWVVPARTAPKVALGTSCDQVEAKEKEIRATAEREFKKKNIRFERDMHDGEECSSTEKPVAYVTPRLLSEVEKTTVECGVHPDAELDWHSVTLPALQPVDLSRWYKGDVKQLFDSEFRKKFKNDWNQDPPEEDSVGDEYKRDPSRWLLYHAEGKFRIRGFVKTHRLTGYFTDFDLPINPPAELVGNIDSSTVWPAIKAAVPHALDVYKSPHGDFAVVRTGTAFTMGDAYSSEWKDQSVIVMELREGKPGRELLRLPLRFGNILMLEWATGANVKRWDKSLRDWSTNGLPKPIVVPRPPDPQ